MSVEQDLGAVDDRRTLLPEAVAAMLSQQVLPASILNEHLPDYTNPDEPALVVGILTDGALQIDGPDRSGQLSLAGLHGAGEMLINSAAIAGPVTTREVARLACGQVGVRTIESAIRTVQIGLYKLASRGVLCYDNATHAYGLVGVRFANASVHSVDAHEYPPDFANQVRRLLGREVIEPPEPPQRASLVIVGSFEGEVTNVAEAAGSMADTDVTSVELASNKDDEQEMLVEETTDTGDVEGAALDVRRQLRPGQVRPRPRGIPGAGRGHDSSYPGAYTSAYVNESKWSSKAP
jgi:hypothetical protein